MRNNEEDMKIGDINERLPLRQLYNRPGSINPQGVLPMCPE